MQLKLLSWNVCFRKPSYRIENFGSLIEKIKSVSPDIVTLQEVKVKFADEWAALLCDIGLRNQYWSGKNVPARHLPDPPMSYQCVIASCWPVKACDDGWRVSAPYPELLGRATVSVPDEGDVDVFTAHIPNWSGNGWKKIDTFHVLSAALRGANDSPRILTGDFNEPEQFRTSGEIVTFGEETPMVGGKPGLTWTDKCGDERSRIEWTNGVLSVLAGVSHHGLRDAYRDRHGFGWPTPVTYCTRTNPRCFDHTFVSRHFDVVGCGYHHDWRKWHNDQRLSDHSAMWAELCLRRDHPKQWEDDCARTVC